MRSKKRIRPFMELLISLWEKNPDERFGQFLINKGLVADDMITWNREILDYGIVHEELRKIQTWGTRGKGGNDEYTEVFIKDLDVSHIEDILETQNHISEELRNVLKEELKFREEEEENE